MPPIPDWEAATADTGLSLEQSYRFTGLFALPGMSERAMLITLPIRDMSGSLIGICGFELSESYFALLHSQVSKLSHPTCLMAEVSENDTYSSFLACGASNDYYYTPEEALTAHDIGGGLTEFRCGDETFVGVVRSYTGDGTLPGFSAIVMTPKADFAKATFKNALSIGFLVFLLVALSVFCCVYVSHRYLSPVLKGLEQIKSESSQRKRTDIIEINNVLDFLSSKEQESADYLASLIEERNTAKEAYNRAQAEIDKLAEHTKDTVDPEAYSFFLERIPDLSKTEREIFDYYVSGLSTKEILESANIKKHAEIQVYDEFEEDAPDLGMTEQQFMDFRSKYLDIYDSFAVQNKEQPTTYQVSEDNPGMVGEPDPQQEAATGMGDIDFCLELLHSDIINVAYILELIADLNPYSEDYSERRKHIIDTMIKDVELRSKAKLIDGFIQKNVDDDRDNFMARKQKADGTSDLEERLNNYIVTERNNAVNTLAKDEDLDASVLNHYLSEYDYLQKEQPEIIQEALKGKHLGLIKRRKALTRILDKLRLIIRTFSWE
mgnify:CR=1 FL=1